MSPMAIDEPVVSRREAWKNLPPPTIYPVKEAKFEKYITPQIDGYETAKAQPEGKAAIVIDNGTRPHCSVPAFTCPGDPGCPEHAELTVAFSHSRFFCCPGRLVFRVQSPAHHPPDHGEIP